MYKLLINKYKNYRKQSYLNTLNRYKHRYAFIGVGHHSISNLYPCLENLNVPLQFIHSRHLSNAEKLSHRFPGSQATDKAEEIIRHPGIKGIFICTHPSQHYKLLQQALTAGKHVFIEKPACADLHELNNLVTLQKKNVCLVALQKRFSTITKLIQKHKLVRGAITYTYRYCTGSFPEGNPLTELFIHPVDNIIRLFGPIASFQVQKKITGNGITCQLLLQHAGGVYGNLELSTQYSWNEATEMMEVNCDHSIVHINYPNHLQVTEKPGRILSMPAEKILPRPLQQKVYFNNTGFVPSATNNNLVVQGFYDEIKHFLYLAENDKNDSLGELKSLYATYDFLEQLNRS